jgi:pSer/pThr/pTyr-binding forkhead associated (FHA) protein
MLLVACTLNGEIIAQHAIRKARAVIGRDPEADVVLDNPGISRQHAEIHRKDDGRFVLKDLGSSNGTLVDKKRVTEETLRNGAVIQIGKYQLYAHLVHDPGEELTGKAASPPWQRDETVRAGD